MGFLSRLFGGPKRGRKSKPARHVRKTPRQPETQATTPDRETLIAEAMAVRRAKQTVLKGLGEADGAERVASALRRVMDRQR